MKALLVLTLLAVSGLTYSAQSDSEVQLGERQHLMTGAENCDGTTDYNSEDGVKSLIKDATAIEN